MNKQQRKKLMHIDNRGQNVIEYLLLVVVFILVLLPFFNTHNGPMKNALENILNDTVYDIGTLQNEININ